MSNDRYLEDARRRWGALAWRYRLTISGADEDSIRVTREDGTSTRLPRKKLLKADEPDMFFESVERMQGLRLAPRFSVEEIEQ